MTESQGFLTKTPEDLEGFLLEVARHQQAPADARERALARVGALATVAGVATATKTSVAAGAGQVSASWLAAKWFAIGLCTAIGGLSVVDQVQHWRRAQPAPAASRPSSSPTAPQPPMATEPTPVAAPSASVPPPGRPTVAALSGGSVEVEARSPRGASASGNFEAPSLEQLSRELAALKAARSALASGKAAQAQHELSRYRSQFPAGVLAIEAAALEVETAYLLGQRLRGDALAAAFLRDHATSPLAARVRAAAEAGNKP